MAMEPHEIQRMNELVRQIDVLERKLAFVMQHLGVQFRDERPPPNAVEQRILAGDRIGAIRILQTTQGLDLAAAKRAVDDIAARLGV